MKARLPFPHTPEQRAAVEALLRKSTTPQGVVLSARIVLGLMDGASAYALARRFGCHVHTAYAARERFLESGGPDRRAGRSERCRAIRLVLVARQDVAPPNLAATHFRKLL